MREGVCMYCDKCHRQSPDNFVNCPYCAAPLKGHKRKKPQKFTKKKEHKKSISFKTSVVIVVAVAFVLALSAVITGALTGSKPHRVIKTMVNAIQLNDQQLYYSLYDDQIKEYYKENFYFGDEETYDAFVSPLTESREFYTARCGADFTLKYKVTNVQYLTDEELEQYNADLSELYNYTKLPKKTAILSVEIEAKGDKGSYKTVYSEIVCSLIGGKWYKLYLPASVN